MTQLNNK